MIPYLERSRQFPIANSRTYTNVVILNWGCFDMVGKWPLEAQATLALVLQGIKPI